MQDFEKGIDVDFTSRECKNNIHERCSKIWKGLGLRINCNCKCHSNYNTNDVDSVAFRKASDINIMTFPQ